LYSDTTWRKRQYERKLRVRVDSVDALVDMGVELRTVVADRAAPELLPGLNLRVLRAPRFGGILDTRTGRIVGPTRNPRVWYCSEDQEPIIRHADTMPLGIQAYGSEGAGKTTVIPKWLYFRWLELLGEGREVGVVAPTARRLRAFLRAFRGAFPSSWYAYTKTENLIALADGTRVQLVSAHQSNKDEGSPIQSFDWSSAAGDEDQDMVERHDDIEARGRAAKRGRYKQLRTATPKDSSKFRAHKDKLDAALMPDGKPLWTRRVMLGKNSPFVDPSHWERLRQTLSPREYQRRVEAQDVGVELAVYYGWDHARNITPRPRIASDVTAAILSDYPSYIAPGASFTLLCGHDPGVIWSTTVVLRLIMFGDVPTWMVVGELQTKQTTAGQHARELRAYLQQNFGVNLHDPRTQQPDPECDRALVMIDPHGKGESETDYQTVYTAFQKEGLDSFSPSAKRIKRSARVGMINRLLYSAAGTSRLLVACDHQRAPAAPRLVEAFETLQKKPGDDNPEGTHPKDIDDKTHAPAACGYALWPFEQEMLTLETIRRARQAARGHG
jgi:hypothetical protein